MSACSRGWRSVTECRRSINIAHSSVPAALPSYGSDEANIYHLVSVYAAKVLKGEMPADLPVRQSTKVELIVQPQTAKALGLSILPALLARADEVIE